MEAKGKILRDQKRGELRRSVLRIKILTGENIIYHQQKPNRRKCQVVFKMRVFPNFDSLLTQFVFDLAFTAAALFQREIHEG